MLTVPTGAAAYNVHGHTLHSVLSIPVRGNFKDLEGERLTHCTIPFLEFATSS